MKIGLRCSTDPTVTHKVWIKQNNNVVSLICNGWMIASLSEYGLGRYECVWKDLGFPINDKGQVELTNEVYG